MKFRKKPVVIDAMQWTGVNFEETSKFFKGMKNGAMWGEGKTLIIETLEGQMYAKEGDWIIKGVEGEFYPCKPDIFIKTYDPVL